MPLNEDSASQLTYVPLAGSAHDPLPNSKLLGPIDPSEVVGITVLMRSKGSYDDLKKRVLALYEQPLQTRQYFTRELLDQEFGAREEDFRALDQLAQKHDLIVTHRRPERRTMMLTGKLGNLLEAFKVDLHTYDHQRGTYRGQRGEIHIPAHLDNRITAIFGFDTRKRRSKRRLRRYDRDQPPALVPSSENPAAPFATFFATEYAKRYNFPESYEGMKLDGTGQCLAFVDLGLGFNRGNLAEYFRIACITLPSIEEVSVPIDGQSPTDNDEQNEEVMEDVEPAVRSCPRPFRE